MSKATAQSLTHSPAFRAHMLVLSRHAVAINRNAIWGAQFQAWMLANYPGELNARPAEPKTPKPRAPKRGGQWKLF